ncbi:methionine adenosyltransferase [Bacillus thuringiensis]|uniref:methionine adenosyltransferase n=1 Tax=Bacillus thuringiensis TaxID=1428 RepID=UPI000789A4FB|nr:methionine adenosyltransferase [Bacillus thuringiensis]HDR7713407.1 S-adenosylmethionine synthetase [Bacillus cereus]AMR88280.1 S-adenosylmethionine synthetase [Bacillus thuringiensis]MBG9636044.1 S-adenosylmethionine synthetase [Bacillus thuringiensis]MBG9675910.1 S-adenosylmethionine synthetase [Bacillus thuringiensis]MEC3298328.1 methionine adenosyltransferase [Bacillus thuringiensis]
MSITVNKNLMTPDQLQYEVVERKGLGHPDTLTDGIAEAAEIEYCKYCLDKFRYIPHHNFDKVMILGGQCMQKYGGEKFSDPIQVIFMGRGSKSFGSETIPMEEIQIKAAKAYLSRVLPHLDVESESTIVFRSITSSHSTRPYWFSPRDKNDLPEYSEKGPTANDTATMISYWPLTKSEQLALDIEGYFYQNNEEGLPYPRFKEFGGDIKVMVVRDGDSTVATVTVPQITTMTATAEQYFKREQSLRNYLTKYVQSKYPNETINLIINTQTLGDNPRPYLVTAGSCTDFGEEGAVGRGNKTHGIISSFRPNTMEAPHGKNSTYFVGKVLGYQADVIAKQIYAVTGSPCQIILRANIGDNLYTPSKIIVSTAQSVNEAMVQDIVKSSLSIGSQTTLRIINEQPFLPRTNVIDEGVYGKDKY